MWNRFGCFILCDLGAKGAEGLVLCAVGWFGELKREEPSHVKNLGKHVYIILECSYGSKQNEKMSQKCGKST